MLLFLQEEIPKVLKRFSCDEQEQTCFERYRNINVYEMGGCSFKVFSG